MFELPRKPDTPVLFLNFQCETHETKRQYTHTHARI